MYTLKVRSHQREELVEFTDEVQRKLTESGAKEGIVVLYVQHTTAGLTVNENADPDVRGDLERFLARLVPDGDPLFKHVSEGPDDMPAHMRSALTNAQLSIPVVDGRMVLGTWQGVYVWEHRRRGHAREVVLHLMGD